MFLVREMPVKAAATLLGEHDTRIWRVLDHYVQIARAQADYSDVKRVGIDETSARRGQDYISLFFDLDQRRLLFGTGGKDHETVKAPCGRGPALSGAFARSRARSFPEAIILRYRN